MRREIVSRCIYIPDNRGYIEYTHLKNYKVCPLHNNNVLMSLDTEDFHLTVF